MFIVGALLSFGLNILRGSERGGIPWVTQWSESVEAKAVEKGLSIASLKQTQAWSSTGTHLLLDARPPAEYQAGHIPGAMSLPYHELESFFPDIQIFLTPDQPVITYCSGKDCEDSLLLGEFLLEQGYTNIYLFEGGMNQWQEQQLPEEGS